MKTITSTILTCLVLMSAPAFADEPSTNAPATTAPDTNRTRVACVGDSITFGAGSKNPYPAQLQTMLGDNWEVKNFGISGRTLLKKGDAPYWNTKAFRAAQDFQPNIVVILLGANDTKAKNWIHHDEFYADYKELVETFKNLASKPKIFICRPTPVFRGGSYGINEANVEIEIPLIDQLAAEEQVGIIDLHAALANQPESEQDGVHPTAAGDTILAQTVADVLTGKAPSAPK